MAEQSGEDKYIKCSKCKCKYINDDEHIKADFGYNRLNERYKTCVKCRTKTSKTNNLFNILPDNVIDTIHKYKHQMEFKDVINDITNNIYVYGDCPKCKCNCDDDMPCWLDTISELRCDPEWVMTYGHLYEKTSYFKTEWYSMWKTGQYVKPKIDKGDYRWLYDLNDVSYFSD